MVKVMFFERPVGGAPKNLLLETLMHVVPRKGDYVAFNPMGEGYNVIDVTWFVSAEEYYVMVTVR